MKPTCIKCKDFHAYNKRFILIKNKHKFNHFICEYCYTNGWRDKSKLKQLGYKYE